MSTRKDDELRIRPGSPRNQGNESTKRFASRVVKAASHVGARRLSRSSGTGQKARGFGRGLAVGRTVQSKLDARSRRVTIKLRLVNLKTTSAKSTSLHLRYIERDGVDPEGNAGVAYGPTSDPADTRAFELKGREDRHQFRMIVSPEDAIDIGDLNAFTRNFMQCVATDLGTRFDWIAVDHWDTDNPHTHIVLRGKDQNGQDLIIAKDYIAHGMRVRAAELATEWLGPRTEKEIRESLTHEVEQERWTSIDRALYQEAREGRIDLKSVPAQGEQRFRRSLKLGRLQHLQRMGLSERQEEGVWSLNPQTESALRAMGERGDIIRTMQRALGDKRQDVAIHDSKTGVDLIGRVIGKGLADELQDRGYLIVESLDSRAHYVSLPLGTELADYSEGAIVRVRGARGVDRTIAAAAEHGIYRSERHLAQQSKPSTFDVHGLMEAHVRRLEALRRAGIVERVEQGVWRIPDDFVEKARDYDVRRAGGLTIDVLCRLPLKQQIRARAVTWLDRQLADDRIPSAERGFSGEVRSALRQRLAYLVEAGFAERLGSQIRLSGQLLARLRDAELQSVSDKIAEESGLRYQPPQDGRRVSGIYRRSVSLVSGQFAMLERGTRFTLVPWRPVIEKHLGREVRGVVKGLQMSWDLSRQLAR